MLTLQQFKSMLESRLKFTHGYNPYTHVVTDSDIEKAYVYIKDKQLLITLAYNTAKYISQSMNYDFLAQMTQYFEDKTINNLLVHWLVRSNYMGAMFIRVHKDGHLIANEVTMDDLNGIPELKVYHRPIADEDMFFADMTNIHLTNAIFARIFEYFCDDTTILVNTFDYTQIIFDDSYDSFYRHIIAGILNEFKTNRDTNFLYL